MVVDFWIERDSNWVSFVNLSSIYNRSSRGRTLRVLSLLFISQKSRKTGFTLKDNILVEELETSDVAYIYNGDKLLSYGNQSITYDVLERPTSFMGKTITWVKVNQITKIDNLEIIYDHTD